MFFIFFFFFQAEDGIRDFHVTGVQTCALPICLRLGGGENEPAASNRQSHERRNQYSTNFHWQPPPSVHPAQRYGCSPIQTQPYQHREHHDGRTAARVRGVRTVSRGLAPLAATSAAVPEQAERRRSA